MADRRKQSSEVAYTDSPYGTIPVFNKDYFDSLGMKTEKKKWYDVADELLDGVGNILNGIGNIRGRDQQEEQRYIELPESNNNKMVLIILGVIVAIIIVWLILQKVK